MKYCSDRYGRYDVMALWHYVWPSSHTYLISIRNPTTITTLTYQSVMLQTIETLALTFDRNRLSIWTPDLG